MFSRSEHMIKRCEEVSVCKKGLICTNDLCRSKFSCACDISACDVSACDVVKALFAMSETVSTDLAPASATKDDLVQELDQPCGWLQRHRRVFCSVSERG